MSASASNSVHADMSEDPSHNPFMSDPAQDRRGDNDDDDAQQGARGQRQQEDRREHDHQQYYQHDPHGEGPQQGTSQMHQSQAAQAAVQQQQPARRPNRPTLRDNLQWKDEIKIIDAQKTSEGASSAYISYLIRSPDGDTRRRYSEFESLRSILEKLYPVLIIPPIPPHHSLTDYAAKQGKAKEDANVIARRKRMLQTFLNRLGRHPILAEERVFQRFLEPNLPWSEVLHSPPVTLLPKNPLKASARTPADPSASALYAALPGPGTTSSATGSPSGYGPALQEPDQRFLDSEIFTTKFSGHITNSLEKINRRTMKRWAELSADYAELGAVMNGFSLNEGTSGTGSAITQQQGEQESHAIESLSRALESTGQAIDSTYLHSNAMLQEWERTYTEPLGEYAQFSNIIKHLLKYRHQKHLQFEMTRDTLETKKATLEDLERSEMEARKLDQALSRALSPDSAPSAGSGAAQQEGQAAAAQGSSSQDHVASPGSQNMLSSSQLSKSTSSGGSGRFGFLAALSHTLNGMVDNDPEATRRNNIGKTRDQINQLQGSIQAITQDLRYANQMIQADLDRFQRQKVGDFREMGLSFSKFHIEWCRKNLEMWKEAKNAIDEIDDTPATMNVGTVAQAGAALR